MKQDIQEITKITTYNFYWQERIFKFPLRILWIFSYFYWTEYFFTSHG